MTEAATPHQSFIVEFIGLPGIGKTTLALEVLKCLTPLVPTTLAYQRTRNQRWLVRRFYSTRNIFTFACWRPHYALHSGRVIRASGQRSAYDALKVTNNWLSVSADTVAAQYTPSVCLFDQGMFQALWSVGYSARKETRLEQLTALSTQMPKPDLLVLLRAEHPAVLRRLAARGGQASRLDLGANAGAAAQLSGAAALLADIVGLARTSAAVRLLELDASCDEALASNARHVADTIRTTLQPGRL